MHPPTAVITIGYSCNYWYTHMYTHAQCHTLVHLHTPGGGDADNKANVNHLHKQLGSPPCH